MEQSVTSSPAAAGRCSSRKGSPMKRGWTDHPKAKLLAMHLGVKLAHADGMWARLVDWAAGNRPSGMIDGWRIDALPEILDPPGSMKGEDLLAALVKSELVDKDGFIHDWPEHCEDSVHMKLARAGEIFACGCSPHRKKISDKEWRELIENGWQPIVCDRHRKAHKSVEQAPKPSMRNLHMDALSVCEGGPDGITGPTWAKVAKALAQIREVTPDVTPEEITKRIANYRTHFKDAACTATAMASHWGRCAEPLAQAAQGGRAGKHRGTNEVIDVPVLVVKETK